MNVEDAESVEDMVSFVVEKYGRLDYCMNVVGASRKCFLYSVQKPRS